MEKLHREVLKLNKSWQVIGVMSVQDAISDMAAGAVTGLYTGDGELTPLRWREWINLVVKNDDDYIQTAKTKILLPKICICVNFNKLIVNAPKMSMKALRERDKDTCIYSGKKLKPSQMSKEHIIPVSLGGKDTWENLALCDRNLNSERGNMSHEKFGKHPLWKPFAPRGKKPEEIIVNRHACPEWDMFLKAKNN